MSKRHSTRSKGRSWWAAKVEAFERVGGTQRAFCEARGLRASTFAKWRRRLRGASAALVVSEPMEFIELELPAVSKPLVCVNVRGVRVDFETLPPPGWVAELAAYEAARC